jgi:hypothetical protein
MPVRVSFAPRRSLMLAALTSAAPFCTTASAQGARAFIRVTARDSSGAPIRNAELAVMRGLHDVLAHGATDSAGGAVLSVDGLRDSTDLQVVMRKIGYQRGDHFFPLYPHDTVNVKIVVGAVSARLPTVEVRAATDLRWKSYHLDADDIASSDQPFTDAWDVVKRLRPDILRSRGGCATGVQEVWINGKRVVLPLEPIGMAKTRAFVGAPPNTRVSYIPISVLSDIAPEHIQEMMYHDCFDHSMAAVGSVNALFVTLKPGVAFQQDVGSFVVDSSTDKKTNSR